VSVTAWLALGFVVLLALEWRYRYRSLRIGVVLLTLVVWYFVQPVPYRAVRRAWGLPPAERVTRFPGGRALSEYESGVFTLHEAIVADAAMGANARRLCLGVLVWLACSPAFRRVPPSRPVSEPSAVASADTA
jgi:hypothetical protein